jgi:hypothetical protein
MDEEKIKKNNLEKNPKTLHTYMSDMADAVRENEMSVIKVAMAEQKSRERGDYYRQMEGSPKKKIIWAVSGILIIAVAIVGSYFLIQKAKEKNMPPIIIKKTETPISYDNQATIDITNATSKIDVTNLIDPELASRGDPESIKVIFLNKITNGVSEQITLKDFLSLLKTTAPGPLLRSFSDDYMIGTYTPTSAYDSNHLFLIIKINDYNQAYAGMLEWEKTLIDDFFTLFHINVAGENSELFEKPFKDIIIKNKDSRILYTKDGVDVLFYLFPDKNTLVITDNQDAIKEIIARLLIKQTKPL